MKFRSYYKYGKYVALILVVLALFGIAYSYDLIVTHDYYTKELPDGWTIEVNGQVRPTDSLTAAKVGTIGDGDTITLSRTMDDEVIKGAAIMLRTIHSVIDVYLDGEKIYEFGRDYYDTNRTVPKKYNYIPLGYDYTQKELKIVIMGTRKYAFSGLPRIYYGTRDSLFVSRSLSMRLNLLLGTFLIVMGLTLMVLSPYLVIYHNNDLRLFFCGLLSLLLGLYNYSFYGLIDYLIENPNANTTCEYASLLNIPTALLGYLMSVFHGRLKKIFRTLFLINLGLFAFVYVLCITQISRINDFTGPLHALAFVESFFCIFAMVREYIKRKAKKDNIRLTSGNIFLGGILIFILLSINDIYFYNYNKYVSGAGEFAANINGFTLGSVIFVSGLLISYLLYNIQSVEYDSEKSRLTQLAFSDPLTGLSNRARCEQIMDMLSEEHGEYTIISLDLNRLKEVNDKFGHHEGDRLLTGFSTT